MAWYSRCNSRIVRSLIIIFALFVLFVLPLWTMVQFVRFFSNLQIKTVTETKSGTMLPYPNLTVSHSKFFDNNLLKGIFVHYAKISSKFVMKLLVLDYNISNTLANYMTMVLDPNVKNFAKNILTYRPGNKERLNQLNQDLELILDERNVTVLELFYRVAIR